MKFESQRVAWWFFATCMLLFCLQLVYGLIMGFAHAGYDVLHGVIPFHVARATHTNLLVMWLLAGFMGAAYYIIPEECDRELYWPKLAYVQLAALVAVGVTAVIGFHFQWWEGRKFLEIPRPLDYLVVVDVLLFIANIGLTVISAATAPVWLIYLCLIVTGAVHGNEVAGTHGIRRVIAEIESGALALARGSVTFVPITNPKAYALKRRNGDRNLNRNLQPTAPGVAPAEFEDHIANWLCPLMAQHDALLDLHGMIIETHDDEVYQLRTYSGVALIENCAAVRNRHDFEARNAEIIALTPTEWAMERFWPKPPGKAESPAQSSSAAVESSG
mgnify:CR=1 FL=1